MQNTLAALQHEQQLHDELAHRDILELPFERRMTHMALHFAKYSGRLLTMEEPDADELRRIVVDTAIIALTSANALDIALDDQVSRAASECGATYVSRTTNPHFCGDLTLPAWLGAALCIQNARIAKACEAFDHAETFPYEEVMALGIRSIAKLVLTAADIMTLDLADAVRQRWASVEEKYLSRARQTPRTLALAKTA